MIEAGYAPAAHAAVVSHRERNAEGPRALSDFAGRWTVERRIADARAGTTHRLSGLVEFVPDERGLSVEERGLLRIGDAKPLETLRRYHWRFGGPGRIAVHFDDGRPFHSFTLATRAEAGHDCPPDRYRVAYDFSRWPRWRAVWTVTGPRKEYVSTSDYARLGG